MRIGFVGKLTEAYRSDDGVPTLLVEGSGAGEGWTGEAEILVRAPGLQLDGLRIGDRIQVTVAETVPEWAEDAVRRSHPDEQQGAGA